jgi:hypothetical protein
MLTQEQTRRLIALPIGWRRRLVLMPGPGRWVADDGATWNVTESPEDTFLVLEALHRRWAWAPADRLAWLECAFQNERTEINWWLSGEYSGVQWGSETQGFDALDPHPIDAALSYMESHDPPEDQP